MTLDIKTKRSLIFDFFEAQFGGRGEQTYCKKKKKEKPAFCWTKNLSAKIDKGESGIKKSKGA